MTSKIFTAACVQLRAGRNIDQNITDAGALIREAASRGADLIVTPEMTALMERDTKTLFATASDEGQDRALAAFQTLARELERWLIIGSLAIKIGPDKAANRCFVIAPDGAIFARYDKIHMFDVDLPGGETYRESQSYQAGDTAVVVDVPWGRVGLSICYDLRFAGLYRALAQSGAAVLCVPAAFTQTTGKAHWHVLARARAIETGSYVLAAAQGGAHEDGRETFGHSLIVDPWGEILVEADQEPCVVLAKIDPENVALARRRIPALTHDRAFASPNQAPNPRAVNQ
ncbi:MAG: carbon-nitrogen hydrolase family protein [Alphaproteobacteria bacterium]